MFLIYVYIRTYVRMHEYMYVRVYKYVKDSDKTDDGMFLIHVYKSSEMAHIL
jgi:hypothetical protein